MKKAAGKTVLAILVALVAAAGARAGTVSIKGSNTFGEKLGPRLIEAYRAQHPDATFELESKGSATGFAALLAGTCDIASASRPANEEELRIARSRGIKLKFYSVGYYGVAVMVNQANPLKGLSDRQVADIFSGRTDNWKDLGWEDHPIEVFIRDPASATRLGFQEVAMAKRPYAKNASEKLSYRAIAKAISADPYAIGYSGVRSFEELAVRALSINGIPPNDAAVNEGLYPYARLIRFYTNAETESQDAKGFIRFVQSADGRRVLADMGYVPRLRPMFGRSPTLDF